MESKQADIAAKPTSSMVGDALRIATGTGSAQIVGVLAAPLIARLFAPSAFGVLAVFAAVSAVIQVVSCLRYELSIFLPEKDNDGVAIVALCSGFVVATTTITSLLVILLGARALHFLHADSLRGYLWLLPVDVFVAGMLTILNCWNMRQRKFARVTTLNFVNRLTMTGAQVLVGLAGFVSGGALIAATIFGSIVQVAILGPSTIRDSMASFSAHSSFAAMRDAFHRYSRFPRFGLAAALLNRVSWQLPPVLLSLFFNAKVVGEYSFGYRVLRVPGNLIGTSFASALFPHAAEANSKGTLGPAVDTALRYLVTLGVFPCFLLGLIGRDLFVCVFGNSWSEAGVYAQLLSLWLFFWFVSSPLTTVFAVLEEQALELRFQVFNVVTRFASLAIGGFNHSARLGIALFALSGAFVYGGYSLAVIHKSGASLSRVLRLILTSFLMFVPTAGIIFCLRLLHLGSGVITGASTILLIGYYLVVLHRDTVAREMIRSLYRSWRKLPHSVVPE